MRTWKPTAPTLAAISPFNVPVRSSTLFLAPDVVLTSATSKDGFFGPGAPISVLVGSTRLGVPREGSERLDIIPDSAVTHPNYDPKTLRANLMLFKIRGATSKTSIVLADHGWHYDSDVEPKWNANKVYQTLGFGRVTTTAAPPVRLCKKWIVSFNRTTNGMLCGYSFSKTNTPSPSDVC
jgi:hypothetical protein